MKKIVIGVITIYILIMIVVFFDQDNSLSKIQESNTIRIGYAIEAPYAFLKPNGDATGLSIEEAKEIATRLGIGNIEWRLMEFGSLINELELNKIDVIASGMFITKERSKRIIFSEPTFKVKQGMLVAKGNPKKIISYEQAIRIKDSKIATLKGSIEESLLRVIGFNDNRLLVVPDAESGKIAVETGLADGFALSLSSLEWMANHEQMKNVEIASPFEQPKVSKTQNLGYGAFEFQKHDVKLRTAWNKELKKFIGSPKHREIIKKYGFSTDQLQQEMNTKKILND